MVKYKGASDDDYQTVSGHISLMCKKVGEKVAGNWEQWEQIKGV